MHVSMNLWRVFNKGSSTRRRWHKLKIYAAADFKISRAGAPRHRPCPFDPGAAKNKGPGTFPSSRLDSHRNFEPFLIGYVDIRSFPTRFAPKSRKNLPKDPGGTTFGAFRVPDGRTAPGGGPSLCPQGARWPDHPRWGTTLNVFRVP